MRLSHLFTFFGDTALCMTLHDMSVDNDVHLYL